jgi:hypothetical protein
LVLVKSNKNWAKSSTITHILVSSSKSKIPQNAIVIRNPKGRNVNNGKHDVRCNGNFEGETHMYL